MGRVRHEVKITIRPFTMEDYPKVWQLWQLCRIPLGKCETKDVIQKKLERDPDIFLVAEMNKAIAGVIMGTWDGSRGRIYNHVVDPRCRRLGIGKQLFLEVEKMLLQKGAPEISVMVPLGNLEGEQFYESLGFKADDRYATIVKHYLPGV